MECRRRYSVTAQPTSAAQIESRPHAARAERVVSDSISRTDEIHRRRRIVGASGEVCQTSFTIVRAMHPSVSFNSFLRALPHALRSMDPISYNERWRLLYAVSSNSSGDTGLKYIYWAFRSATNWCNPNAIYSLMITSSFTKTIERQDSKVRMADVATKAGRIKRKIHKLALPIQVEGSLIRQGGRSFVERHDFHIKQIICDLIIIIYIDYI